MGFAIGFVALGLIMFALSTAVLAIFGFAIKITFSWVWFVVVGVLTAIIVICEFCSSPLAWFKKEKKNVTVS